MTTNGTIRVLLLASEFHCAQMRFDEVFANFGLEVVETTSPGEFFSRLRGLNYDVMVVTTEAVSPTSFLYLAEEALEHHPRTPLIAIGPETDAGRDAMQRLEEGAADYLTFSQIQRLPLVIQRLLRERASEQRLNGLEEAVREAQTALLDSQKLMGIGLLAASIAHEINNPLESITNLLYLLRNDPSLSPSAESYVTLAEREMSRVAQISKQTLNFHRETLAPVKVRPADLLDEVLVLYSRRIEEKQIRVIRQYRSDISFLVFPGEMRQVLSNLITNAIEATPSGGSLILRVRRSKRWLDEGIEGVRIIVADNGSGIPPAIRQHLGQIFYTTKGQRGTGLGLWVTRAIVERYGGELRLFSSTQPHRHGTCFSIFVPTNMRPKAVVLNNAPLTGPDAAPWTSFKKTPGAISINRGHESESENTSIRHYHRRRRPSGGSAAS